MPQGPFKAISLPNPGLTPTGPVGAATQITVGPGTLKSVDNLVASFFTTTAIAALTTSQVGSFYDAVVPGITSNMTALTTSQVAALTTSQLTALAPPTVAEIAYGGDNGHPINNGLVFVPGTGQIGNILKK